jgi:hypothetical protein
MPEGWKVLCGSVKGSSHELSGQPCQDYAHCRSFEVASNPVLVAVCSDGAGSALHADAGAKLACMTFLGAASKALNDGLRVTEICQRLLLDWARQTRARLSLEACVRNLDPREFACTLLTAIVSHEGAVFSQIGDGAIVVKTDKRYETVFWPQNGEYVNTTFFLTGADFEERLQVRSLGHPVDDLALFTDGLQFLALDFASRSVHNPFFEPMFESLRAATEPEPLEGPFTEFLNSKPVNDRTDDDRTLILATRRSA